MQTEESLLSMATRSSIHCRTASMPARICSGSSPPRMVSNCRTRSLIPSIPFSFTESTKASSKPICWMTFLALPMISNRSVDMGPIRRCGGRAFPCDRGPEKEWRGGKELTAIRTRETRQSFPGNVPVECLIAYPGIDQMPLKFSDPVQTLLPKKWSRNRPKGFIF